MCLIALAWRAHPRYRLVLAANRDEFHDRPTLPLAEWTDSPGVFGGRDALHGGGWLAVRGRRLAAVTNVRRLPERDGRSRGELVAGFVRGGDDASAALRALADAAPGYRPFNLIVHDGERLGFATNSATNAAASASTSAAMNATTRQAGGVDASAVATRLLAPGLHGVSNGPLEAPWPKTALLTARLDAWLAASARRPDDAADVEPLLAALADTAVADDARLPDTGVGLARERFLSPAFIAHPLYGTRASSVVLMAEDHVEFIERRFGPDGRRLGDTRLRVPA